MVVSTRLSRLRQTSQKRPRVGSKRPGIEDCLPPDVLEAIMKHLDQEALCAARLVSKTCCAAASAHVYSLTLASTSKGVSFHRFPHPKHVTVTHVYPALLDEEDKSLCQEESWAGEEGSWAEEEASLLEEDGSYAEGEEGLAEEEGSWAEEVESLSEDEGQEGLAEEGGNWVEEQGNLAEEEGSLAEDAESVAQEESLAQLDPCLRDLATALTIRHEHNGTSIAQTRDFLSQAALLPKLRKLEVEGDLKHEAALVARLSNLEAIRFGECTISVAETIATMTRLTSLHMGSVPIDDGYPDSADFSWLGHVSNLRSLQALSIRTSAGALPVIGNLTGLTGLTMSVDWHVGRKNGIAPLAPLTRLTRLKSICISNFMTESCLRIACSLGSGSLETLDLNICSDAVGHCGRLLALQTALTQLSLGGDLGSLRHIKALRIEALHCLKVDLDVLDAEGLSVLRRATSVTKLSLGLRITPPDMGLGQVVGRLTQLRSLSLTSWQDDPEGPHLVGPLPWGLLTGLTELAIRRQDLDEEEFRALLVLTNLRVLELHSCCWPGWPDEVPSELGVLTNLHTVRVLDPQNPFHIPSLARVRAVLFPLRYARGLPPLRTPRQ